MTSSRILGIALGLVLHVVGAAAVPAYDLRSHGLLTERAFDASPAALQYLRDVRLDTSRAFDLPSATSPQLLSNFINNGTLRSWLVEGSIREDDYHTDLPGLGCEPPHNPSSAIDRVRHHFLDPVSGRGLSAGPLSLGLPAPAWALGEQGRGSAPHENQFSLLDARLYQLRSLIRPTPEERERQAALLFRSLGQVIHLVQDMAQPQHTRNDSHPLCDNLLSGRVIPERSWYEAYVEQRVRGLAFRGRPTRPLQIAHYPPPALPTFWSYFTDTDRRGLADFSSRNFLSAGTNLGTAPPCGGRGEPPCRADAYQAVDVPHVVTTARGVRIEAPVRLLRRSMVDPISQAVIPDVAVTSRSVWDQHLETRGLVPAYSMNVLNYDSISEVLLPRAVGYAAGFLDDFFRGRLDASVQPAGETDPGILRLVARNASDTAVDGVLLVYAEDSTTRERRSVLTATDPPQPLGAVSTGVVLAGQPFAEIRFRPPFPAEKYVVVYHGKRLGPRVEDPPAGDIGAVMAQVLGGPRVEAIVPQDDRRLLRAVGGTFALPPTAAGLELIQWSDVENHFVGLAGEPLATGQPGPDEIRLFRIERPAGSADVPLVTGSDPPVVDATLVATVPFPYGLALPTVVDYIQRVRVQQPVLTYERTSTLHWDEGAQGYRPVADVVGPPGLEIPVDETVTFAERFPIVLDRAHLFGATLSTPRPYSWRVLEVGQDARERLLAVVLVQLTRPADADRTVVLRSRSLDCATFEPRGGHRVSGFIPGGGLIAVVDVGRGEVLGTTGAPLFAPSSTELAHVFPTLQVRRTVTQIGGPTPGVETLCLDAPSPGEDPGLPTQLRGTVMLPTVGITEYDVPGQYRSDVEAVVASPVWIHASSSESRLVYARSETANHAVQITAPSSSLAGYLTLVREAVRMRPGSRLSSEVLLRFDRPEGIGEVASLLVRWDPASSTGTRRAVPGLLDPGTYRLVAATPDAALLTVERLFTGDTETILADLATDELRVFPGDITDQFVLLPPAGLYGVETTHFHTLDTLAETALPPALAPGPAAAPPVGAYHVIVRE
jgi:hypothetical protein